VQLFATAGAWFVMSLGVLSGFWNYNTFLPHPNLLFHHTPLFNNIGNWSFASFAIGLELLATSFPSPSLIEKSLSRQGQPLKI